LTVRVMILDDYGDTLRTLGCFAALAGHDVTIWLCDVHDPLLPWADVIPTPHIGFVTRAEFELQFATVFDQVNAFAAGSPINVVNPAVLEPAG
jgi:phosphoglycerate dehydrogenase-like enzyme